MQAATGLHAAHELAGADGKPLALVHRDVSPQNILLGFEGKVCVADFGIAKLQRLGSLQTESGYVKGKYAYMSPEQVRGRKLDRRSDVFSLGIVLHEALTGSRLFDLDGPGQTALAICDGTIPDPRTKRADVPEAYASVAMRALAREPEDRFETADAMARALRATVRERHAAADEEHLRALLARVAAGERDALAKRLERIASESAPELPPAEGAFGYATTVVDPAPPSMDSPEDSRAESALVLPTSTQRALPIDRGPRVAAVAAAVAILGGIVGAYAWLRPAPAPAASAAPPPPSASLRTADTPPPPPASPPPADTSAGAPQPPPKAMNDPKPLPRGRPATPPIVRASATTSAMPPAATPTATSSKGVPFRSPF
jgi:serine/threonine-protein kinase